MKAVILAAGDGGRLRPLTLSTPKPILETGGRPLIHYTLDALGAAGITDIGVVVGYQAEKISAALQGEYPWLTFIYNEAYQYGNGLSLYAARSFVSGEPFVLSMADHLISSDITRSLMAGSWDGNVLCVDRWASHPSQVNDATRVMVDGGGYIEAIGKDLDIWNAVDTGVFRLTDDVFVPLEALMRSHGAEVGITDVVTYMGQQGERFATCNVSGMFWADVDTPEDYRSINIIMREGNGDDL